MLVWRTLAWLCSLDLLSVSVFLLSLVVGRLATLWWRMRRLPPGPYGIPVLGYLPFFRGDTHLHYMELAKRYGPVFSLRLGNQTVVVLSDYKMIREAFRKEEFTGRPQSEFTDILGGYGVINIDGNLWKDQRRFLHEKLRKFGMTLTDSGRTHMENRIMREVHLFLRSLVENRSPETDLNPVLATSISNVICSIIMSVRFTLEDPQFKLFMDLIAEGFKLFARMSYVNFIPIMRYLPGLLATRTKIAQNRSEMGKFFQETVDSHKKSFDPSNIRDIVDTYLMEIKESSSQDRQMFGGRDPDRQIQQVIGDLFTAGMETVKTTLQWSVVYMLRHPEIAKTVQEELDQVVGRGRLPTLRDREFLPYTECVIREVLRISSVVPLGSTHAVTRDVQLGGYTIPQGVQVVPHIHAVHMDPTLWDQPNQFRPERFLTPEGKVFKPDYFIPFGVGRRMCLGDVLARMELFLFFSSFLHCFHLAVPEGHAPPSVQYVPGITLTPKSFKVALTQRPLEGCELDFLTEHHASRTVGSH
ncbi:hypothetical protein J6590_016639 [Homalodisca vitripennis]|nr:hypothetical protein J6590_016637 [Homalodisca vitripennis]KAG8288516.1 hypothetical protein J6590_016639 [Homalodisca vitripennis]